MTIEEMCLWLEMHENPKYDAIIETLRAAQRMRKDTEKYMPMTMYGTQVQLTPGMKAFDAATGEKR